MSNIKRGSLRRIWLLCNSVLVEMTHVTRWRRLDESVGPFWLSITFCTPPWFRRHFRVSSWPQTFSDAVDLSDSLVIWFSEQEQACLKLRIQMIQALRSTWVTAEIPHCGNTLWHRATSSFWGPFNKSQKAPVWGNYGEGLINPLRHAVCI